MRLDYATPPEAGIPSVWREWWFWLLIVVPGITVVGIIAVLSFRDL